MRPRNIIPILLAFLLNRILSKKTKQKIQLVLYMPNFISVIVLCGIVRIMLSPTGMINSLLGTQTNFMTMPSAFRTIYIASGIWQGAGWASIIYTAALSNASKELKEAAVIDGANIFQQIKAVEWPAIKDTVLIQFIMAVGNIMSIGFEKAYALQTDMNISTSEIISTYVYKKGLLDGDYGRLRLFHRCRPVQYCHQHHPPDLHEPDRQEDERRQGHLRGGEA